MRLATVPKSADVARLDDRSCLDPAGWDFQLSLRLGREKRPNPGRAVRQWSIGGRITIDATINPDYSHVEADEPQVTRNQRFEVLFPERRPFFLEHADLFDTPETAFFSRRIQNPDAGLRVTGDLGGLKLAALVAEDRAEDGRAYRVAVSRVRKDFGDRASLGGIWTETGSPEGGSRLAGGDVWWKFSSNWSFTGQWLESRNARSDRSGSAILADLSYRSRNLFSSISYRYRSPEFVAALGYMPRVDLEQAHQAGGYRFRSQSGGLLAWGPDLEMNWLRDASGMTTDWSVSLPLRFEFRGPREFVAVRQESMEFFGGTVFRKQRSAVYFSDESSKRLSYSLAWGVGSEINYYPAAGLRPFLGQGQGLTARVTFRPDAQTRIDGTWIEHEMRSGHEEVYRERMWRLRLARQITRRWSVRAITDINTPKADPRLVTWDAARSMSSDVLVRYQVNPWTSFYAGFTDVSGPVRYRIAYVKMSFLLQR